MRCVLLFYIIFPNQKKRGKNIKITKQSVNVFGQCGPKKDTEHDGHSFVDPE